MLTHWFIWKGKNSFADFGLWVRKLPKRTLPKERYEEIEIPGRPGSLILTEGEDVYAPYQDEMVVSCKNTAGTDRIREWLRGSGELILSDDTGKARTARIVNEVSFEREEKDRLLIGTVPFLFQPFRKSALPQMDTVALEGGEGTVRNPGDIASKPVVRITGDGGDAAVTIGGETMTFFSLDGTVTVDCGARIITSGGTLWGGTFSGEFWRIPRGASEVTSSGAEEIVIEPEWRWV